MRLHRLIPVETQEIHSNNSFLGKIHRLIAQSHCLWEGIQLTSVRARSTFTKPDNILLSRRKLIGDQAFCLCVVVRKLLPPNFHSFLINGYELPDSFMEQWQCLLYSL